MIRILLWLLLSCLPLTYALHPQQQKQLQAQEHMNATLIELIPTRKGSISDGSAVWTDSLGGEVTKQPSRQTGMIRYTCLLKKDTILYHTDKWGSSDWKLGDSSFFLSPDILASVMTEAAGMDMFGVEGSPTLHVFKVEKDVELIYWYKKYYAVWFEVGKYLDKKDFQGCTTQEHKPLINLVCETLKGNGWRAPYDQDEVMLCHPNDYIKEIAAFSLETFHDAKGGFKGTYSWEHQNGKSPSSNCKEPCMYAEHVINSKGEDARKEVITLLNNLFKTKAGEFAKLPSGTVDIVGQNIVKPLAGWVIKDGKTPDGRTYADIKPDACKDEKCC